MDEVTAATTAWNAIAAGGVGFVMFCLVLVLYKGFLVTKGHCEALLAAERSKTELMLRELERREGLYIASLAEMRTTLMQAHEAREKVQAELAESTKAVYRFTDVLADIRDRQLPR